MKKIWWEFSIGIGCVFCTGSNIKLWMENNWFDVENFHLIFIRHYEMYKILYFYHGLKHAFVIIKFCNRRTNAENVQYYFGESTVKIWRFWTTKIPSLVTKDKTIMKWNLKCFVLWTWCHAWCRTSCSAYSDIMQLPEDLSVLYLVSTLI